MAVTNVQLITALRLSEDDPEELAEARRLKNVSAALVESHAADAPEIIRDEACLLLAAYLFDKPLSSHKNYGAIFTNSGAGDILLKWYKPRIVSTGND